MAESKEPKKERGFMDSILDTLSTPKKSDGTVDNESPAGSLKAMIKHRRDIEQVFNDTGRAGSKK